ncbi:polysaccharide biosynthesis protein [Prochlorococcus marinus]|uniref:polysaccharide biosynthesis protein n=1 Tax=Prochlorococcus marinus TaxID=1219 RepID=UPI00019005CF|nr:nucleoside-diphosphate sugar epimerase/dehydratase [Prochlorococcus marinus]EEE39861.1 nucleotide-diphosphate-sugar epimerase, membrane associated [Prochlorococcus marinus str. MIT 9202]
MGSKSAYKIVLNNLLIIFIYYLISICLNFPIISNKVVINYFFLSSFLIVGIRFFLRDILTSLLGTSTIQKPSILIYGAGSAGSLLEKSLRITNTHNIICFVDDNESLWGKLINDLQIYPPSKIEDFSKEIDEVFIAIPSIKKSNLRKIVNYIHSFNLSFLQVPSLEEITSKKTKISSLRRVDIEDLLGREKVNPNKNLLGPGIIDQNICVTGAGGSIGSELCRQITKLKPKTIVLLDISESNLYKINEELKDLRNLNVNIVPILGNAVDEGFILQLFNKFKIDVVFHTAAYKHVPLVELNPIEAIKNNFQSTVSLCSGSVKTKVKKFVFISSDKAVRPTNIMGASKRLCELVVNSYSKNKSNTNNETCFSIVRFGNVLNSSGSVVPLFKKQIKNLGPITLTHPDVIRYFMTIEEAAQLVIQALVLSTGGEVFLLDMGEPIRIKDLAEQMIRLSGFTVKDNKNQNGDIEIKITGLRPGEKLYEELLINGESLKTSHEQIFIASESNYDFSEFQIMLDKLEKFLNERNLHESFKCLSQIVPEWKSELYKSIK